MFDFVRDRVAAVRLKTFAWLTLLGMLAVAIVTLCMGVSNPAHAQEVARSAVVDFGPALADMLLYLAPTIVSVVGLFGVWVLQRLGSVLKLKVDAGHRQAIEQALHHAVGFALEKVGDKARGGIPIDLKSDGLAVAVSYAQRSIPGAIGYFGITDERLRDMVESRMEHVLFDPAADVVSERPPIGRPILSPGAI